MRPVPARVLLSTIAVGAFTAGALFPRVIFFVLAAGASVLLATSLVTRRQPLTRALRQFQDRAVDVRLWGVPAPGSMGTLTLTSVNTLGAGTHLFFSLAGGASMHLKIAQPGDPNIGPDRVVVEAARFVQWNGRKVPPVDRAPAVSVALIEGPASDRPGSVPPVPHLPLRSR